MQGITDRRREMMATVRERVVAARDMPEQRLYELIRTARTDAAAVDAVIAAVHAQGVARYREGLARRQEQAVQDHYLTGKVAAVLSPPPCFPEPDLSSVPESTTRLQIREVKEAFEVHCAAHRCQPRECELRYQLFRLWQAYAARWNTLVLEPAL